MTNINVNITITEAIINNIILVLSSLEF